MTNTTLTAVQGGAQMWRGEGFTHDYPTRETRKAAGFTYASDMLALAVNRDDAKAFMFFMDECGGPECEVLLAGSVVNYAALHGASKCIQAMFSAGLKSDYDEAYWLKKAETPAWGPRAKRQAGN
jgi:hypothetical protein